MLIGVRTLRAHFSNRLLEKAALSSALFAQTYSFAPRIRHSVQDSFFFGDRSDPTAKIIDSNTMAPLAEFLCYRSRKSGLIHADLIRQPLMMIANRGH